MRKLVSWLLGLGIGSATGIVLVWFLAPVSGPQLIARLRQGWAETLEAARSANQARRAELEAELARLQKRNPTDSR
jgi:hypothetical protein